MKTSRRLRRHLSYANVMATIAVFVALGGVSYAAATISGNKLIKGTVGAGKLKNGTLTSTQVKANSLTGGVIDESTLTIVPSAQTANSATTATTAGSADTAKSATTAQSADTADTAKTAASAEHALSADTATSATTATSADSATTAANADTVEGLSAEELKVACPAETELFGGMCWDEAVQSGKNWIAASRACGDAGGRLPSLSELVAYVLGNTGIDGETWTGEVSGIGPGNEELVFTRAEAASATAGSLTTILGYRCLFYRVN
ncbi:MAG TPA: hypothetical protein VGO13_03495 [Solirubrobacterales bacterium]|jgi:cytoskeletal protein RodZ|nr:hypothetical protein [Solirubrobacterales bacterium]